MKPGKGFGRTAMAPRVYDADRIRPMPSVRPEFRQAERVSDDAAPAIAKENALQHEVYMQLVRMLPCAHCGKHGPSQFCHADMGKGQGLKTDCRRGFPGCPECHTLLGSSGKIPRAERRELEARYGDETRARIIDMGIWPKRLPQWNEK